MVKILTDWPSGRCSPKPTVLTVSTVWKTASSRLKPSKTYPTVPPIMISASTARPIWTCRNGLLTGPSWPKGHRRGRDPTVRAPSA